MSEETLNILNELSKIETTDLALNIMELTADNMVKDEEIERLNNIINELKKYIEDTKQDGYKLVWINEYKNYFEAGIEEILGSDKE